MRAACHPPAAREVAQGDYGAQRVPEKVRKRSSRAPLLSRIELRIRLKLLRSELRQKKQDNKLLASFFLIQPLCAFAIQPPDRSPNFKALKPFYIRPLRETGGVSEPPRGAVVSEEPCGVLINDYRKHFSDNLSEIYSKGGRE